MDIYVKNTDIDSPMGTRITENTVAWLHFLPDSEKLFDIASDSEDPIVLSFDKSILKEFDFRKICGLGEKKYRINLLLQQILSVKKLKVQCFRERNV